MFKVFLVEELDLLTLCAMRSALSVVYQVGYFLSPLDFLKECLTFFLFKAAFKRLVFFRLFIFSSTIME
ncbi:MAG: hypothetical protein COS40_04885 [Deltaproteobacteria bacterium CG03_land_8_20_14_0_80_45_14]|nr:MAG: hypothetical protein COS40_04885 [Deltaproteobacteria bacterium CG03_land_8_20_14_0_80_45_14]